MARTLLAAMAVMGVLTMAAGTHTAPEAGRMITVGAGGEYATIQAGVNAAMPGDTVLVAGGQYNESVRFARAGEPGRPITVKAMAGHIVLVTPGVRLQGRPRPVADRAEVMEWAGFAPEGPVDQIGLWEAASHLRMTRVQSVEECERRLGSWHYDAERRALYIRSSGAASAAEMLYMVESAGRPCFDVTKSWIVLDGLWMAFGAHGALVGLKTHHVTVRDCRAFCNRSAGLHVTGDDHLIERNELFQNNQYGLQLRHGLNRVLVTGNLCYFNGPNNGETTDTSVPTDMGQYSKGEYVVFEGNIVDGLHQCAFRNKFGGHPTNVFRHNVVKGFFDCAAPCIENNTILVNGIGARYGFYPQRVNPNPPGLPEAVDPGGAHKRDNLFHPLHDAQDPLFADPSWRDYRLQGRSPYLGRGAHPGVAPVLYVDPEKGDDGKDGRSVGTAFKTLAQALLRLHPDYTVYLMPGVYQGKLAVPLGGLSASAPLRFRAYGRSAAVVLEGGAAIEGQAHVALEGLTFRGTGVVLNKSSNIALLNCAFTGCETSLSAMDSRDVRADHVTFQGGSMGVLLARSAMVLTNSLFAGTGVAVSGDDDSIRLLYEEFNTYSAMTARVGNLTATSMDEWRALSRYGRFSRVEAAELDASLAPRAGSPACFAAADFTFAGGRPPRASESLEIRNARITAVHPNGASLLWETPRGATESRVEVRDAAGGQSRRIEPLATFQIMGEYFDMTMRTGAFYTTDRHACVSGLVPGQTYEATITAFNSAWTASNSVKLQFTLPAAPAPGMTYYVSTQGNDAAAGTSIGAAWRSFRRAVSVVGPGDRVIVLPGVYGETLRPRTSGTADRPILFESAEPQGAVIDLMESLPAGIEILNADYVHVKGFKIVRGKFTVGHNVLVANARGVHISSCRADYPAQSSFAKLAIGHGGLVACDAPELTVDNNVFLCGYVGVALATSPGSKVLNNTIVGEGNYGVVLIPGLPEERYEVRNNLFYRAVMGYKTGPNIWMMNVKANLLSDYNLFHIPAEHKATIGKLPDTDRLTTLPEWQAASGLDRHSVTATPLFVDPARGDFRLTPNSPGREMAEDGGPVGVR